MSKSARRLHATCFAIALVLTGCDQGADQAAAGKAAGAQVLPGTISDAMIDTDQSRSQPLLQPPPPAKATAAAPSSDDADDTQSDSVPAKPEAATPAD